MMFSIKMGRLLIKYAYFMNSGVASVLNVMRQGKTIEVGLTGTEGFVGLPLLGASNPALPARLFKSKEAR
jgi:hypothetical protein